MLKRLLALLAAATLLVSVAHPAGLVTQSGPRYTAPADVEQPQGDVASFSFQTVVVARDASSATKLAAFTQWDSIQSEPTQNAAGWVYTATYASLGLSAPPSGNTRGLAQEFFPAAKFPGGDPDAFQPNPYLQWGDESSPIGTLPANVWIRYTVQLVETFTADADNGEGSQLFTSTVAGRDKSIYPSREEAPDPLYGATFMDGLNWDFVPGSDGFEGIQEHLAVPATPRDEIFLALDTGGFDFGGGADNELVAQAEQHKLYQNLNNTTGKIVKGIWTEVTLHLDTSQAGGVWRAWIKKEGQARVEVAHWVDPDHPDAGTLGATASFQWNIPADERVGHKVFQLNSVINSDDVATTGDHMFVYDTIDIATNPADLPDYDNGGPIAMLDAANDDDIYLARAA